MLIWGSTYVLHIVAWGYWFALGLTALVGVHAARVLLARSRPLAPAASLDEPLPFISVMVAAKNEERVIARLLDSLGQLDYPRDRHEIWVIDDNSSDRTHELLRELAQTYTHLNIFRRLPQATGGKSGALNEVLPLAKGEIIAVFDADSQIPPDLFQRVVPLFHQPKLGAVQVRKHIANLSSNLWLQGQDAEMALDTLWQQQRIAIGGIGELRGNGQFVRRQALEACGGWNEKTITDDLDLTLRLHLNDWDIDFTIYPLVQEEGVETAIALWHQRNRWAEGGYQRYLDYYQLLLRNRLGVRKSLDLFVFWVLQYALPTATIPDTVLALWRHQPLLYAPLASLSVVLSVVGMSLGLRRIRRSAIAEGSELDVVPVSPLVMLAKAFYGTFYMFHWLPVVASTTARMAVRPNRLKWVKTVHYGKHSEAEV